MDLVDAVGVGRLEGLRGLRDLLAETLASDVSGSERASLAGRLMVCLSQIEQLEKSSRQGSMVDEIADRRKARRAGTSGASGAGGHRVNRRVGGRGAS